MKHKRENILPSGNLIGICVRTTNNEKVGKVEDVTIDINSGRLSHLVLSSDGCLFFGGRLILVSWEDVELKQEQDGNS